MRALFDPHRVFIRFASAYALIFCTIFISVPLNTTGQRSDDSGKLKADGDGVALAKRTNQKLNKMSAGSFTELTAASAKDGSNLAKAAAANGDGVTYRVLNVEFTTPLARRGAFTDLKQSRISGATVLTTIDRFADIFIDSDDPWRALLANPDVVKVEYNTRVEAPPPPEVTASKEISQAPAESIVRNGYKGLTGKNVIIAVLDTGIDFRHPDFINYDVKGVPTSRISYLWDTATPFQKGRGASAPFKFPNGSSIGTLYNKLQLTAELRSTNVNIPPTDIDGHGTACASVAAGNGNADKRLTDGLKRTEVVGVAPDAEIIGVRLGHIGLENTYLLNAIAEWVEKVAGKTPFVISGSFGGHYTGHDGQRIEERQLNARFPLSKPGRAIVFAAGNEGNDAIHSKVNFTSPAKLVSWHAEENDALIKIYFDSADEGILIYGTKATPIDKIRQEINPITKQLEVRLNVPAGIGGIWFENHTGKATEAHLYFMNSSLGAFSPEYVTQSHLVGTPGAMDNAITVGSYDWNDNFHSEGKVINLTSVCRDKAGARMPLEIGWLSCYSSPGPSRSGAVKPDIAAPGEWYPSANARQDGQSAGDWAKPDSTGYYRAMNGTSAATPYTSGIVALMLQKKPTLTLGEIKTLLKMHATKTGLNPFSTGIPNHNWGYGKLDAAAIDRMFAAF